MPQKPLRSKALTLALQKAQRQFDEAQRRRALLEENDNSEALRRVMFRYGRVDSPTKRKESSTPSKPVSTAVPLNDVVYDSSKDQFVKRDEVEEYIADDND